MAHASASFNGRNERAVAERLYRVLLFVYPAKHRREYGPLLVQLFRDLCRDSYRQKGPAGLIRLWIYVLGDTIVTAAVEHFFTLQETLQKGVQVMTKRQHGMILYLSGLPLGLGVFLFLINPRFMSQLFKAGPAQPLGWLIAAAILILAGAAYIIQRKTIVRAQAPEATGPARFLFAISVWLLVMPALLLVLLGPAIVMILQAGLYP